MIRRPPRSTLFPLHDALPISEAPDRIAIRSRSQTRDSVDLTYAQLAEQVRRARLLFKSLGVREGDRKSTRLNSSHSQISYAVFCLKKKKNPIIALAAIHPEHT